MVTASQGAHSGTLSTPPAGEGDSPHSEAPDASVSGGRQPLSARALPTPDLSLHKPPEVRPSASPWGIPTCC